DSFLALAQLYTMARKNAEAEVQVRKALQVLPRNTNALVLLATLQIAGGHLNEAEQTYKTLSSLPDRRFWGHYGAFLHRVGKREEAIKELETVVKQHPSERNLRSLLISAYVLEGRAKDAEALMSSVLKRNPNDVDALVQRAEFYARAHLYDQAEQDVRT